MDVKDVYLFFTTKNMEVGDKHISSMDVKDVCMYGREGVSFPLPARVLWIRNDLFRIQFRIRIRLLGKFWLLIILMFL
jgi:hypothetical protein